MEGIIINSHFDSNEISTNISNNNVDEILTPNTFKLMSSMPNIHSYAQASDISIDGVNILEMTNNANFLEFFANNSVMQGLSPPLSPSFLDQNSILHPFAAFQNSTVPGTIQIAEEIDFSADATPLINNVTSVSASSSSIVSSNVQSIVKIEDEETKDVSSKSKSKKTKKSASKKRAKEEDDDTVSVQTESTTKRSRNSSYVGDFVDDPNRYWTTHLINQQFMGTDGDVEIRSKTRRDTPCLSIPEKLYSSLKYEIRQTATGNFVKNINNFYSKIDVVDADTLEEVRKNNAPVLRGDIEGALVRVNQAIKKKLQEQSYLSCTLKAQFFDITYHNDRRELRWRISYYAATDEKRQNPVLIKLSPAFKVYARKPNQNPVKKEKSSLKNKEEDEMEENENEMEEFSDSEENNNNLNSSVAVEPSVAAPVPVSSSNDIISQFNAKLEDLTNITTKMSEEERAVCFQLLFQKISSLVGFSSEDSTSPDCLSFINSSNSLFN